jgi:hypothetical protein
VLFRDTGVTLNRLATFPGGFMGPDIPALLGIFMGSLMVLIPIAGFTARFAMKPIVESIARLRESGTKNEAVQMLERRMALLEQEVQNLSGIREEIGRLVEELEFQRKLGTSTTGRIGKE